MIKGHMFKLMLITSLLFSITLLGCGGGGGGDGSSQSGGTNPAPFIQVTPSTYNFGIVTPGNSTPPLYVEIKNSGTASLNISNISLLDMINFTWDLNGGSKPCGSTSRTLIAGDRCTIEVRFQPQSNGTFSTDLKINSNSSSNSTLNLPLSGTLDDITALTVRINQVEMACPAGVVTAYVSVTDQGGYPVTLLTKDDFSIAETSGYTGAPTSSPFVENNATLSVALVLDYSSSITWFPDKVSDLEEGAVSFVNQLGADDEAEIIRFGLIVETAQSFTSDKNLLLSAINTPWTDTRFGTALYDAGMLAVDDTALRLKDRRAVVLMTDGYDHSSINEVNDLIYQASLQNIPFFPVGLGDDINVVELQKLADDTGGQFYAASTSDNLQTVYQQLADVLFSYQYILTYNSGLVNGTTADLTVGATLPATTISGINTRSITACP